MKAELLVRANMVPLLWQMLRPYSTGPISLRLLKQCVPQHRESVSPKMFLSEEEHTILCVVPMLESGR